MKQIANILAKYLLICKIRRSKRRYYEYYQSKNERIIHNGMLSYLDRQQQVVLDGLFKTSKADDIDMIINMRLSELRDVFGENELYLLRVTMEPLISDALDDGVLSAEKTMGRRFGSDAVRQGLLVSLGERVNKVKNISDNLYKDIQTTIGNGLVEGETIRQLQDRIKDLYGPDMADYRAKRIAATESAGAVSDATHISYQKSGIKTKAWLATNDGKTRPSHMSAQNQGYIPIEQTFSNGLRYPGDQNGSAKEVVNCRCALIGG